MKLKNKILTIILLTLLGATACDDMLDVEPQQGVNAEDAINTADDLESAVIGMYSILGGPQLYGTNLIILPELLGAEENLRWRGTFQSYRELEGKTMTADNAEASRTWIAAYNAINLANIILSNLDVVEDQDQRARIEGEALFVRGTMHFELVRLYAKDWNDGDPAQNPGVLVRTTPTTTEAEARTQYDRASVAAVYTQVIQDLQRAKELLPEINDNRATTYAASAFLARVYLQKSDFTLARDEANRVIESNLYRLNPTVTAAFRNDNTAEVIFEIQQNDQNNAGDANDGLSTFYASLPGIGRGDVQIISDFDPDANPNRYTTYDLYEENDTRLTDLFYIGSGRRAGRIYAGKWLSPGQNLPIVRLAEMYLIRAEANFRLGTSVGASPVADVNMVRNRAGITELTRVTLADILLERRLELAYEGARIHDLRRTKTDLQGRDADTGEILYTIPWNDPTLILPIPKREIDASGGQLEQNPGY
ncbi:RagB/SusD family nutrient uptake outer membrane protein [Pontibacter vulgaris]|uniref:RagB/SusD family nutrient uptake outer membrane protein n=1 Tax=Pontibacter vulgaris TaxID=2905679 RepID=UPI001FA7921F|nr:RagB/SusD family nutrient uptake outer membrane protein [Pontibacter vulgaris]